MPGFANTIFAKLATAEKHFAQNVALNNKKTDTMTTETKTTDFDTVKGALKSVGLYDNHPDFQKNIDKGIDAAHRMEASHSALVAALEAILADKRWAKTNLTIPQLAQAEAAIALAKGNQP